MGSKRLAVLTSGGDAPGMNAAVRAITRIAIYNNAKVFGVFEGYEGLVSGEMKELDWDSVGGILSQGGTFIGTARSQEFRTVEGRRKAAYNMIKNGIDSLVVVGGDGSLTGADLFRSEWSSHLEALHKQGRIPFECLSTFGQLTIVGLLGSIDNDYYGTTSTIGADSALQRIVYAADMIISTALSHKRNFILEVMGRDCGYLALMAAVATGCEYCLIPECPPPPGWEEVMCNKLELGRKNGRRCSFVIVAEGAKDTNGKPITSNHVKEIVEKVLNYETRVTVLGHVQRGGSPTAFDRYMSTRVGVEAARLALAPFMKGKSIVVGTKGNRIVHFDLLESVAKTKLISKLISEKKYLQALEMRGREFVECYKMLHILSKLEPEVGLQKNGLRIGVMNVGAPAAGMNACVRALLRTAMNQGHVVLKIQDGFAGLLEGDVTPFGWFDVTGWVVQGGCNIGTNRLIPKNVHMQKIAETITKHNIQALVIVGGYDGYLSALNILKYFEKHRSSLDIPIVCIPASISNNLPGTEYSVGCDTALNNIQSVIDKIKQSAMGTKRVYVIEVMGATCGYLATTAGMVTGAERIYTHEEGVSLNTLRRDIDVMLDRFKKPSKQVAIVIVNEKASPTYNADTIQRIYQQEGQNSWEVRLSILGHMQQGGQPTVIDRVCGSRFAYHCTNYLQANQSSLNSSKSGCFGLKDGEIVFTPFSELETQIDFQNRRPKEQWWLEYRKETEVLGQSSPIFLSAL